MCARGERRGVGQGRAARPSRAGWWADAEKLKKRLFLSDRTCFQRANGKGGGS